MIELPVPITTPDGTIDGFVLYPEGEGPWPGILFLTDLFGIRPANRGMARRLAEQGYAVLLPNVFFRSGAPPLFSFKFQAGEERSMKRLAELSGPLTPEAMERDAAVYVDFLAAQPAVAPGAMGVVGYCFTGALALRAAAVRPERIAAAASFHGGRLVTDAPASPHRLLPRIKARLYFGHAVQDRSMPQEAIDTLHAALAAWGGPYESEIYEGAFHGWTVPDSPAYNKLQAERAFAKLTDLLARTLK